MTRYVEFASASNFSFLRGASHPEELMLQAAALSLSGLGLCDRNSVAGVVRAHLIKREQKLALAYHPGARLVFADGTPDILAYPRDRAGWGRRARYASRSNVAESLQCKSSKTSTSGCSAVRRSSAPAISRSIRSCVALAVWRRSSSRSAALSMAGSCSSQVGACWSSTGRTCSCAGGWHKGSRAVSTGR